MPLLQTFVFDQPQQVIVRESSSDERGKPKAVGLVSCRSTQQQLLFAFRDAVFGLWRIFLNSRLSQIKSVSELWRCRLLLAGLQAGLPGQTKAFYSHGEREEPKRLGHVLQKCAHWLQASMLLGPSFLLCGVSGVSVQGSGTTWSSAGLMKPQHSLTSSVCVCACSRCTMLNYDLTAVPSVKYPVCFRQMQRIMPSMVQRTEDTTKKPLPYCIDQAVCLGLRTAFLYQWCV